MKTLIENFETDFTNILMNEFKNMKNEYVKKISIYLTNDLKCSINQTDDYITDLTLSKYSLFKGLKPDKYITYLSEVEQKLYIEKRAIYFLFDDFVYYNVDELMLLWMFNTFEDSLKDQYVNIVKQYIDKFKLSLDYYSIFSKVKCIINKKMDVNVIIDKLFKEYKDLSDKIVKLKSFINSSVIKTVNKVQKELLKEQLVCMEKYASILLQRIDNLKSTIKETKND